MIKLAACFSAVAAALLAACASGPNVSERSSSAPVAQQIPYRGGNGVVSSVTRAPAPATASAGASAPNRDASASAGRDSAAPAGGGYSRLGIRMDDGRMQYVDVEPGTPGAAELPVGTRVQLTEQRMIIKQ